MLRSYRSIFIAVVGLALLGNQNPPDKPKSQRENRDAEQVTPPPSREETEQPKRAARYRNPCGYDNTKDDSDLCAQWLAANSAKSAFDFTATTQYRLGIAEICGLGLSLIFSAIAAIAGLRAYSGFKGAERAHLDLRNFIAGGFQDNGRGLAILFDIANLGKSPAWIIKGDLTPYVSEKLPNKPRGKHKSSKNIPLLVISGEGQREAIGENFDILDEEFRLVADKIAKLYVEISITYMDIFRKSHVTSMTVEFVAHGGTNGGDIFKIVNDRRHWLYT